MNDRKQYWNESYREYWKARVAEADRGGEIESKVVSGDARTEGDEVYDAVLNEVVPMSGRALDVGCAWGRMFPLFTERGLKVSGADISSAMVEEAITNWSSNANVEQIVEAEAENLPFPDQRFDNVFCLATFDATYQHDALTEMLRCLRPGGQLYLTGKHTHYFADDAQALAAEKGARRKGHPNHFTNFTGLREALEGAGHKVLRAYFFKRRGDFSAFDYQSEQPERFYEYFVVVRRGTSQASFEPFADVYSKTFRELEVSD